MRLNSGEGIGASLAGRTSQSTARIARTVLNVAVCRTFVRAVLLWVIDPQRMVTDRSRKYRLLIDRTEIRCLAAVLCPF
jgi:hypothetical protein